jgi:hypothetical protein
MNNKKKGKNPFAPSQKRKVENREALVRKALDLLAGANFETPNGLAISTAQIVSELERKQAKDGEKLKPMSYTTLIRTKSKYKHIVLAHFKGANRAEKNDQEMELEEIKLHCAHLEHENELLKHRLSSLSSKNAVEADSEDQEGRSTSDDIEMLINILDAIMNELIDAFVTIGPNDVNEETPDPGLYGPSEMVAEYDDLVRLNDLREGLKSGR